MYTPPVGGAGHFRLGRLAARAGACVSVARLLCADGGGRTLEHYAPLMHRRSRVQPSCRNAASNQSGVGVHTARGWRRPLSTGSAGSTCGRLRICCSLAVCGRGRAHARALYVIFILNYDYNRSNSRRDKHSRNRSSPPANKYHSNLLLRINTILRSKV